MSVVNLTGYTPPVRYDEQPWTHARLEQSSTEGGTYTSVETLDLDPVDEDPVYPDSRNLTSQLGTVGNWYRIVWVDADGGLSAPTTPGQNTAGTVAAAIAPFATAAELAKIMTVNAASNQEALDRCLQAAAGSMISEIGRNDLTGWELELAAQVNLALAQDLWEEMKVHWGMVGVGSEVGPTRVSRDTFERHAHRLAPLKRWGEIA